jgi:hypothetical protein
LVFFGFQGLGSIIGFSADRDTHTDPGFAIPSRDKIYISMIERLLFTASTLGSNPDIRKNHQWAT